MTLHLSRTPLGRVTSPVETWSAAREPAKLIRYIDIGAIDREKKRIDATTAIDPQNAPSRAKYIVRDGDILVSTVRPNLNAVAVVPPEMSGAVASNGFSVLRINEERAVNRFVFHWVRSAWFIDEMVRQATGASYPAVSASIVEAAQIPLPPVDEQRRIAKILDKADAIRRKRQEAIALTEQLLHSTFLEMFGDPVTNPKGLPKISLGDLIPARGAIVDGPFGSSLKPECYVSSGVRVVRNFNIGDDTFDQSEFKFVTNEKFIELQRSEVLAGDLLMSTKGTLGKICIMPQLSGNAILSASGTVRLRLPTDTQVLGEVIAQQMIQPSYKEYLRRFEGGSIQKYLNLASIRKMEVLVPPMVLQRQFVALRAHIKVLGANCEGIAKTTDSLFNSLVQRAFTGQL